MSHWEETVSGNLAPGDYGYNETALSAFANFGVGPLLQGAYEAIYFPDDALDPRFTNGFSLAMHGGANRLPHQTINQFVGIGLKLAIPDGSVYEVYARARGTLAADDSEEAEAAVIGTGGTVDWLARYVPGVFLFPDSQEMPCGDNPTFAPLGLTVSGAGYVTASWNGGVYAFPTPFDITGGILSITLRLDHRVERSGLPRTADSHPVGIIGNLNIPGRVTGPCECDPWQPTILGTLTAKPPSGRQWIGHMPSDGTFDGAPGNVVVNNAGWPLFRIGSYFDPTFSPGTWSVQAVWGEVAVPTGTTRVRIEEIVTTGGWGGESGSNEFGPSTYSFRAFRFDWGTDGLDYLEADPANGELIQMFTVPNLNDITDPAYLFPGVTMPMAIEWDLFPGQVYAQWGFAAEVANQQTPFLLSRAFDQPFLVTFYGNGGSSTGPTGPMNNQPIEDEDKGVGNGVSTTFTTAYPYVASSLEVTVDGIPVPADQTDPLTGTFDIGFAPEFDEHVVVSYRYQEPP